MWFVYETTRGAADGRIFGIKFPLQVQAPRNIDRFTVPRPRPQHRAAGALLEVDRALVGQGRVADVLHPLHLRPDRDGCLWVVVASSMGTIHEALRHGARRRLPDVHPRAHRSRRGWRRRTTTCCRRSPAAPAEASPPWVCTPLPTVGRTHSTGAMPSRPCRRCTRRSRSSCRRSSCRGSSRVWLKAVVLLFPVMMLTSLVYLAEHWVIDGLIGWAIVGGSFWFWNWHRGTVGGAFAPSAASGCWPRCDGPAVIPVGQQLSRRARRRDDPNHDEAEGHLPRR